MYLGVSQPWCAQRRACQFALPSDDTVTAAATGLPYDRIRIVADGNGGGGGGMQADGVADAFFAFQYVSAVFEIGTGVLLASGLGFWRWCSSSAGADKP